MGVCKFVAHGAWHRAANQESHSPAGISLLDPEDIFSVIFFGFLGKFSVYSLLHLGDIF